MAISFSNLSVSSLLFCGELCLGLKAGTQGVETLEGNKGWEGSQTRLDSMVGAVWKIRKAAGQ
jgi:hypothetical protein